ncbi:hypothetical protein D3C75_381270 [compost metagenome]
MCGLVVWRVENKGRVCAGGMAGESKGRVRAGGMVGECKGRVWAGGVTGRVKGECRLVVWRDRKIAYGLAVWWMGVKGVRMQVVWWGERASEV